MLAGIDNFVRHLRSEGYHPRSAKHSNSLSCCVVGDLLSRCPVIRSQAAAGDLVFSFNFDLLTGTAAWNVDLVLGTPSPADRQAVSDGEMRQAPTSTVRIAIEHKAVMTEHRKAVKNRKRDFEAHHEHVHRYSSSVIAGGILIVNGSSTFKSPSPRRNYQASGSQGTRRALHRSDEGGLAETGHGIRFGGEGGCRRRPRQRELGTCWPSDFASRSPGRGSTPLRRVHRASLYPVRGAVLDLNRSYPAAVLQLVLYDLGWHAETIGNEIGIMAFLMHARDDLSRSQQLRGKGSSNCLPV